MKNFAFLVSFFCSMSIAFAQPCANAGQDTLVCGFVYNLSGLPTGGYWSFVCDPATEQIVDLDSVLPGVTKVQVNQCGIFRFVYHVPFAPCISEDTVIVFFENRSFKFEEIDYKINLDYSNPELHQSPADSCGNKRTLALLNAPMPLWSFELEGRCETFSVDQTLVNIDSSSCTADSMLANIKIQKDTTSYSWNARQNVIFQLDPNNKILVHNFQDYLEVLGNNLVQEMENLCPLRKCFIDYILCQDTAVYDTIQLTVPIHLGGRWHLNIDNNSVPLNKSTIFNTNGQSYLLNLNKDATNYGQDSLCFTLNLLDSGGNIKPLINKEILHLQWKEIWTTDTIKVLLPKEIRDDQCRCNGRTINQALLQSPQIPELKTSEIRMVFMPDPQLTVKGDTAFCDGTFANLKASDAFVSYQWSNGTTTQSNFVNQEGYITLIAVDSFGCSDSTGIYVRKGEIPTLGIQVSKNPICKGDCADMIILSKRENKAIWVDVDSSNQVTVCPEFTQSFLAKVISPLGCEAFESVFIEVRPTPDVNAGQDKTLTCSITSIELTPFRIDTNASRKFYWSGPGINNANRNIGNPFLSTPGTYYLTTIDTVSGCFGKDTVEVKEDIAKPKANAGKDQVLDCINKKVILGSDSTNSGTSFYIEWIGPGIIDSLKENKLQTVQLPGQYIIIVKNLDNDCISSDTVRVLLDQDAPIADAGIDRLIPCDSNSIRLGGPLMSFGNSIDYRWSGPGINAGNLDQRNPTVSDTGIYRIIVINRENSCRDTDYVYITKPIVFPEIKLSKTSDIGCGVDSVLINTAGSIGINLKFTWIGLGIGSKSTNGVKVGLGGWYKLILRDTVSHCEDIDSIFILFKGNKPDISAGLDKLIDCDNEFVSLDGRINYPDSLSRILWTGPGINLTNQNLKKPIVNVAGSYILSVLDTATQCLSLDTVVVTKNLVKPIGRLGFDQTINCKNNIAVINPSLSNIRTSYSFKWSGPGIDTARQSQIIQPISIPGFYVFTINTPNPECISRDTIEIKIDTQRIRVFATDSVINLDCATTTWTHLQNPFSAIDSLVWKDSQGKSIKSNNRGMSTTFNLSGTYQYISYQKNGCHTTGSITISFAKQLNVEVTNDRSCKNKATASIDILYTEGTAPFTLKLNNQNYPDNTTMINNLAVGSYTLRITDARSCVYEAFIRIDAHPALAQDLSHPDTIPLCKKETVQLNGTYNHNNIQVKYKWDDNSTNPLRTVNDFGIYKLTYTDIFDCESITKPFVVIDVLERQFEIIQLPNVFAPNGQVENRTYRPFISFEAEVVSYELQIFNRWGQKVFATQDKTFGWDGNWKGEAQAPDTYIAVIKATILDCNQTKDISIKQALTLLR
ncbi:MAG TPA: gliding motility-associated C-terminal domain-containing protein [Saprospiraceae bacterium]|nr:gliding motility-associated C-terminal domain-containing protein [Saprospiraceae bacterium]